jgi:hypothetical protein
VATRPIERWLGPQIVLERPHVGWKKGGGGLGEVQEIGHGVKVAVATIVSGIAVRQEEIFA